jgi:hypothetical protein
VSVWLTEHVTGRPISTQFSQWNGTHDSSQGNFQKVPEIRVVFGRPLFAIWPISIFPDNLELCIGSKRTQVAKCSLWWVLNSLPVGSNISKSRVNYHEISQQIYHFVRTMSRFTSLGPTGIRILCHCTKAFAWCTESPTLQRATG